jgi:hypothetical protein
VIELVRKFFPSLNAIQAFQIIWKLFPALHVTQVLEMVQKSFPSLNATQILKIIRQLFPSLSATQALEIIRKFFPKLNIVQVIESIGKIFPGQFRQFSPQGKKKGQFDVLDGMITHLTRECGGNVHDRCIVDVTSGSLEKEMGGVNPHSGAYNNHRDYTAQNVAGLETDSCFGSVYRDRSEDISDAWNNWRLSEARKLRLQGPAALSSSSEISELIAVVGIRGGSMVSGRLSARGLANVAVGGWSDDFSFIVGDHRYRCQSYVARFLSPQVSMLHSIDATINELRLEVEDRDELFGSVLKSAGGSSIAVDSVHRRTFAVLYGIQSFTNRFVVN